MVLKSIIITFLVFSLNFFQAPSFYTQTKKRADKVLGKYWPDGEYSLTRIESSIAGEAEIYRVNRGHLQPTNYILFAEAPSKVDTFIYMIIFDSKGVIEKISVLLYKENYGGEIASKRFLRQFEGKTNGQAMKFIQDIDGISGATLSVQSITRSVRINSIAFSNLIKQLE